MWLRSSKTYFEWRGGCNRVSPPQRLFAAWPVPPLPSASLTIVVAGPCSVVPCFVTYLFISPTTSSTRYVCHLGQDCLVHKISRIRGIKDEEEQNRQLELFGRLNWCTTADTLVDPVTEISPTQLYIAMKTDGGSKTIDLNGEIGSRPVSLASVVLDVSNGVAATLEPPHSVLTANVSRPPAGSGGATPRAGLSSGWAAPVSPQSAEATLTPVGGGEDSDFDITGDESELKTKMAEGNAGSSNKRRAVRSPDPDTQLETLLQEKLMNDIMERHVGTLSAQVSSQMASFNAQVGYQMTSFQNTLTKTIGEMMTGLDSRIDSKILSVEERLCNKINEERVITDKRMAEMNERILQSSIAGSSSSSAGGVGGHAAPSTPQRTRALPSPVGSPQRGSGDWTARPGVAYLGGYPADMPRANIEATLALMLKGVPGVMSSWAPAKLGNSARVQFTNEEMMWSWLKDWKRDGKEQNRFKFGNDYFHVWASKEKSAARKQVDRVTKLVASMLKDEFMDDAQEMVVEYGKRKIYRLNDEGRHICIAEAAFRSNIWTVQNLHHWKKEKDEPALTLRAQTFEDDI